MKWLGLGLAITCIYISYWLGREMERQRVKESYERAEKVMGMTPTAWEEWKNNG